MSDDEFEKVAGGMRLETFKVGDAPAQKPTFNQNVADVKTFVNGREWNREYSSMI